MYILHYTKVFGLYLPSLVPGSTNINLSEEVLLSLESGISLENSMVTIVRAVHLHPF